MLPFDCRSRSRSVTHRGDLLASPPNDAGRGGHLRYTGTSTKRSTRAVLACSGRFAILWRMIKPDQDLEGDIEIDLGGISRLILWEKKTKPRRPTGFAFVLACATRAQIYSTRETKKSRCE